MLRKSCVMALALLFLTNGFGFDAQAAQVSGRDITGGPYELVEDGGAGATTSMKQTVDAVIANHRSLKSIQENREVAKHELDASRAGYGPKVDLTGNIGLSNTDS